MYPVLVKHEVDLPLAMNDFKHCGCRGISSCIILKQGVITSYMCSCSDAVLQSVSVNFLLLILTHLVYETVISSVEYVVSDSSDDSP